MKRFCRQSALKQTYYRSFAMLIVIPLVLVFIVAEFVIGYIIRNSAIETIDALQTNIVTTLSNDVRTNSLLLSHFVYSGDGDFLQTAVKVNNARGSDRYRAEQLLQQGFNTAVVPSQKILAGGFYMKDGGVVYVKDNITVSTEEIRTADWYSAAVDRPNTITLGSYDTERTRLTSSNQRSNQFVLVTALATNMTTDRSGEIEVVTFFTESQVGDLMVSQNGKNSYEMSVILDKDGHVLFGDMGNESLRNYFENHLSEYSSGSKTCRAALLDDTERLYFFKSMNIPDTNWLLVTFAEDAGLARVFFPIGGIVLLIVAVLLILFYLFSHYFLNAIINPIHTVCEGMSKLDNSDLDVHVEPTGER